MHSFFKKTVDVGHGGSCRHLSVGSTQLQPCDGGGIIDNNRSGGATHLFDRPGLRLSRNPSEKASLSKGGRGIKDMEFNCFTISAR